MLRLRLTSFLGRPQGQGRDALVFRAESLELGEGEQRRLAVLLLLEGLGELDPVLFAVDLVEEGRAAVALGAFCLLLHLLDEGLGLLEVT